MLTRFVWFVLFVALVGCATTTADEAVPSAPRKKELTLRSNDVRVARAVGVEARALGVDWLEARMRPLDGSSTIDRKGVATGSGTSETSKSGLAMEIVAHDASNAPIAIGFIGVDLNGLARVDLRAPKLTSTLAGALDNADVVRMGAGGAKTPRAPFTRHERGVILASVLDSFVGGGKAPSEFGIEPASAKSKSSSSSSSSKTIHPRTVGQENGTSCEMPATDPDGCFHEVCSVANPELLDSFRQAIADTLKGVLTTASCIEFGIGAAVTIADAFIVIDGPLEMFLGGKTAELGIKCLKDVAIALVENLVKTPLLDALKNFLCSSRDAALPSLPTLGSGLGLGTDQSLILLALDKMKVDVSKDLKLPVGGSYDAVKDVFDTARSCTCGVASNGAKPMRLVDAQGRIACVPCPKGTHYDANAIECSPDDPDAVITMCTAPNNPNAGAPTACGEATPEVLLVKPELCMDVYVREYTSEQAKNGTIPEARIETVHLPDPPPPGGKWSEAPWSFGTSYASCIEPGDDLWDTVESEGYANSGSIGANWVTTKEQHLPGHSCSKDASGVVTCIDVTPYEYVPDYDQTGRAAPGFYWCGFQGSKCKDSSGRPIVDITKDRPLYYPTGFGTDTCSEDPRGAPDQGPPKASDIIANDGCTGKPDGVYCSATDPRGAVKCEGGIIRVAQRCEPNKECRSAPGAASLECGPAGVLSKSDCGDKPDGWWCLDDGSGATWMAYCAGKQIQGGCSCASCKDQGVRATCVAKAPPAACPG